MDKDTKKSAFRECLEPIFVSSFQKLLKTWDIDKYVKKLFANNFILLMLYAQIDCLDSLRHTSQILKDSEKLQELIGITSISASQLSRKLREMSTEVLEKLFTELVKELEATIGHKAMSHRLKRIFLVDASVISICLSNHLWATYRKTKAGVKLHLKLAFYPEVGVYPYTAIITTAKGNDRTQMDNLVVEESGDALYVFDRGYIDYEKFDSYCDNNNQIRFVSRLKSNAVKELILEQKILVDNEWALERIVRLGTPGVNQMKHPLRLIETRDTQGNAVTIVTNDFELTAQEISDIYRNRWAIELFFKWVKQHLKVKKFYGNSENAVKNQIWLALISFCLMTLLQSKVKFSGELLSLQRLLQSCGYDSLELFLDKLFRPPARKSNGGRRKNTWEQEFWRLNEETLLYGTSILDEMILDLI
ncbi:MAG: IS4 family transposase [Bacillota bacterium]